MEKSILKEDFELSKKYIFDKCNLSYSEPRPDKESMEYGAGTFKLNGRTVLVRSSKVTPKKMGQFVTFWKRNDLGVTEAYHMTDAFDLLIINSRSKDLWGQFVFSKTTLAEFKIITRGKVLGKRGLRVYPSWDKAENKQALKTQAWQLRYFINFNKDLKHNFDHIKQMYLV